MKKFFLKQKYKHIHILHNSDGAVRIKNSYSTKNTLDLILTLIDRGGGGHNDPPPSISASVTDKDVNFFSGDSCVFLEKITFSSRSGQAAP